MATAKKSRGRGRKNDPPSRNSTNEGQPGRSSEDQERPEPDQHTSSENPQPTSSQSGLTARDSGQQSGATTEAQTSRQESPAAAETTTTAREATPNTTATTTTTTLDPPPSHPLPSSNNPNPNSSPVASDQITPLPNIHTQDNHPQTLSSSTSDHLQTTLHPSMTSSKICPTSASLMDDSTSSQNSSKRLSRQTSHGSILERIKARDLHSSESRIDPDASDLQGLTCAVCLEVYRNPKFLPCHHTYCAACIEDLAKRKPNKPFKCPSCRKEVVLPPGGVNALQHNFYIKQEDLEKAARGVVDTTKCRIHPEQELDMYCTECEMVLCFKCVLTKHKEHALQDLSEAASEAEEQLKSEKNKLEGIISEVIRHVERQQLEQNNLQEKVDAVKKNLKDRHDTIVAAAKMWLEQSLESVDKVIEEIKTEVVNDAKFAESYLSSLCRLQKNIETAVKTKARVELVEADREMRVGYGCREAVDELLAQRRTTIYRPVVHFGLYAKDVVRAIKQFFGEIIEVEIPVDDSEVAVVEKFCCGDSPDTEVFCICPKDNGTLSISYELRNLNERAPSEGVDDKGKHQYSRKEALGKATWKSRGKGKGVFVSQLPGQLRTYSKGQNTEAFLRLDNNLGGVADIKKETIVTESPYKSRLSRECSIKCGPHRSFDVDFSQTVYVVVEEAPFPELSRRVLLFKKPQEDHVAVFVPPMPACQPSDACFCPLGGEHVLLVSDEMNDVIYVLSYEGASLTFLRYLAAGCPLLVQPTALNVDVTNRLWVACRGGGVLMVESKSSDIDPAPSDL